MKGGISLACVHYLWSDKQRHIDADRAIKDMLARGAGYVGVVNKWESKRPLVARSRVSAASSHRREGMWLQSRGRRGYGSRAKGIDQPHRTEAHCVALVPSRDVFSLVARPKNMSLWLRRRRHALYDTRVLHMTESPTWFRKRRRRAGQRGTIWCRGA